MRLAVICGLMLGLACGIAGAQATMTEAIAKDSVAKSTFIQACEGDAPPMFTVVQIAPPTRRKVEADGKPTLLYPVHARYTQMCVYGDQEVRAEVDLRMSFFKDAFGNWTGVAWGGDSGYYEDNQAWDNTANGVRCRVQGVNNVTVDKDYKILTRKPVKDTGYFGCMVKFKAAD